MSSIKMPLRLYMAIVLSVTIALLAACAIPARLPDFTCENYNDLYEEETFNLYEHDDQVVFLFFDALTWCPPCHDILGKAAELWSADVQSEIQFVYASLDSSGPYGIEGGAKTLNDEFEFSPPIPMIDADAPCLEDFRQAIGIEFAWIPQFVLVEKGTRYYRHKPDWNSDELVRTFKEYAPASVSAELTQHREYATKATTETAASCVEGITATESISATDVITE